MHFAVISTVGERNDTLVPLVNRLLLDGVGVIIVANGPEPVIPVNQFVNEGWLIRYHSWHDEPVNLSKIWNIGLDTAHTLAVGAEYVVAVLNDDLMVPENFVQTLGERIFANDAAGAFPTFHVQQEYVLRDAQPVPLHLRMTGFAFALRGSKGLRADEQLLWWYGDDDLDWRIRLSGGNVGVPGLVLQHFDPDGYTSRTPGLALQAGRDRQTFADIWGRTPW